MIRLAPLLALLALTPSLTACAVDDDDDPAACDGAKCDDLGATGPNLAGTALSPTERQRIIAKLGDLSIDLDDVPGAQFVLHDTAGATGNGFMQKQVADSRGPLADGPALWLSPSTMFHARPLYDEWRPTTSLFERAKDVLPETEAARLGRALWSRTPADLRARAMQEVLTPLDLSDAERESETAGAGRQLAGEGPRIFTTATWTVRQLCTTSMASDPVCATMAPFFKAGAERVARSVNLEIGQIAGNNCLASGSKLLPYTDAVYRNLTLAYLESAAGAGVFPETTTHFDIDKAFRGHCDPRCLDLDRLYRSIATELGHEPGTMYGVTPKYGTTYGTHTIWWSEPICGAKPR